MSVMKEENSKPFAWIMYTSAISSNIKMQAFSRCVILVDFNLICAIKPLLNPVEKHCFELTSFFVDGDLRYNAVANCFSSLL